MKPGSIEKLPKSIIWLIMSRPLKDGNEKPLLYVHKEFDNEVEADSALEEYRRDYEKEYGGSNE